MKNFDFNSDKLSLFFMSIKPRKFLIANLLGNILLSMYLINYILRGNTARSFSKY